MSTAMTSTDRQHDTQRRALPEPSAEPSADPAAAPAELTGQAYRSRRRRIELMRTEQHPLPGVHILIEGVDLLQKPYAPAALVERVRRTLDDGRPGTSLTGT